jgi:uncharacterized membrane protein YdbT with pleckstrin-like domain
MSRLPDSGFPNSERVILSLQETMVRNNPVMFVFLLCLVFVPPAARAVDPALHEYDVPIAICSVLGSLLLLSWWLRCLGTKLVVTDRRTILRRGILGKSTNEVMHIHVRNIRIRQSLFQRLTRVGEIGISSSGQADIEIFVEGVPNPYDVKSIIDTYRYSDSIVSSHPVEEPERNPR